MSSTPPRPSEDESTPNNTMISNTAEDLTVSETRVLPPHNDGLEADARFRNESITAYGSDVGGREQEEYDDHEGRTKTVKLLWCPFFRKYFDSRFVKAVHIVPDGVTDPQWGHMFGPQCEVGERDGYRNALVVHNVIMNAFAAHVITLLPIRDPGADDASEMITRWKVMIVLLNDSDGKELSFLNDARPNPAVLYYHYIMSLAKIRAHADFGGVGWEEDWERLKVEPGARFAVSGPFLSRSMLRAVARYLGDGSEEGVARLDQGNKSFEDGLDLGEEGEDELFNQVLTVERCRPCAWFCLGPY